MALGTVPPAIITAIRESQKQQMEPHRCLRPSIGASRTDLRRRGPQGVGAFPVFSAVQPELCELCDVQRPVRYALGCLHWVRSADSLGAVVVEFIGCLVRRLVMSLVC